MRSKMERSIICFFCLVMMFNVIIAAPGLTRADFDEMDTNKDGKLTFDETVDAVYGDMKKENSILASNPTLSEFLVIVPSPDGEGKFAIIDTNRDGRLSESEVKAVIAEFKHIVFNTMDSNGDSFVTFEENLAYDRKYNPPSRP